MGAPDQLRRRRRIWEAVAFVIGVLIWLVVAFALHYPSVLGLCLLAGLAWVWFLADTLESWLKRLESSVKRMSLEAVGEALSPTQAGSSLCAVPGGIRRLQAELRNSDFVPYAVSIQVNPPNLQELWQKVGLSDGQQWINGMRLSSATPAHALAEGISFVVVSSDGRGNPQLVYRTDGNTPRFQRGLHRLGRSIEEISCEEEGEWLFSWHPSLCFGELLYDRDDSDTYKIAVRVDHEWWRKVSPDVESHWDHGGVYLIVARIPKQAIHGTERVRFGIGEPLEDYTAQLEKAEKELKTKLEKHGWRREEYADGLVHRFFWVIRHDLDGTSSVGQTYYEFGGNKTPERADTHQSK